MGFRIATSTPIVPKGKRRRARVKPTAVGQRHPRIRDKAYLGAVAQLSCVASGRSGPSECAHVRYGDALYGKPPTGMSEKPDDKWAVPLSAEAHRLSDEAQHGQGERAWWLALGIDPIALCLDLQAAYPSVIAMEGVVSRYRAQVMGHANARN